MRASGKANPWVIVKAHYATYVDARTGHSRLQDWVTFTAPPVVVLAGCLGGDVRLGSTLLGRSTASKDAERGAICRSWSSTRISIISPHTWVQALRALSP